MFCRKCGKELPEGARFCVKCGEPVSHNKQVTKTTNTDNKTEHAETQESKKRKVHIVVPIIVIVVILLLVGIFVGKKLLQEGQNPVDVEDTEEIDVSEAEKVQTDEKNLEEIFKGAEEVKEEANIVPEESEEKEGVEAESMEEAPDYAVVAQRLADGEMATTSQYEEIAVEMARIFVGAKLLNPGEEFDFQNMDAQKNVQLNYTIINSIGWGALASYVASPEKMDFEFGYKKDEMENIFHSFYMHDGEMYIDNSVFKADGEMVRFNYADGDGWISFSGYRISEDENHILISAPCYYGSNGGEENIYQYHVDILLQKAEESIWGLQIVYAKAYQKEVSIASVEATSQLPDYQDKTYKPENLIDHNTSTPWVENVSGTGIGEVIVLHLGEKQLVQDVLIYNGYQQSIHLYDINGKVTGVEVDFGDGNIISGTFWVDEYYGEPDDPVVDTYIDRVGLEHPVYTDTITIKITDACEGTSFSDTCISEIKLY